MPFKSEKQRKWMHANKPKMAKKWEKKKKNEAAMELNKIKDAIKMFQKKIEKQGRVTNARDEEHLKNLIKLYIQMGGKGVKESVNEGQKRDANNLTVEFGKSYQKFTVAVNGLAKSMTNITGDKTDGKIIMKAFKKHIIPFVQLVDNWNSGQQKNPHIDESVNEAKKMRFDKDGNRIIPKRTWLRMPDYAKQKRNGKYYVLSIDPKNKKRSVYLPAVIESVNEANIKDIEKVLKTRSAKKIDGMYMDMTTANAIMTVYKALNQSNKKKFAKLPLKKMVDVTWKLVK